MWMQCVCLRMYQKRKRNSKTERLERGTQAQSGVDVMHQLVTRKPFLTSHWLYQVTQTVLALFASETVVREVCAFFECP